MTINLNIPNLSELKPRITVFGVGGAGGNAVNNMIESRLRGRRVRRRQYRCAGAFAKLGFAPGADGHRPHAGLGAGSAYQTGAAAAEEALPEIPDYLAGAHMAFITAGMGGGTVAGASYARAAKNRAF
jgi:cell division protein FtsZ